MKCDDVIDFYESDPKGGGAEPTRREAEAHLVGCTKCSRLLESIRKGEKALADFFAPLDAPEGFASSVLRDWPGGRRREGLRAWRAAAALIAVGVLGALAGARMAPEPGTIEKIVRIPQPVPVASPPQKPVVQIVLVGLTPHDAKAVLHYLDDAEVVLRKVKNRRLTASELTALSAEAKAMNLVDRGGALGNRIGRRDPRLAELFDGLLIALTRLTRQEWTEETGSPQLILQDIQTQGLLARISAVQQIAPDWEDQEEEL